VLDDKKQAQTNCKQLHIFWTTEGQHLKLKTNMDFYTGSEASIAKTLRNAETKRGSISEEPCVSSRF